MKPQKLKIEDARLKDFVRIDLFANGRFVKDHLLCLAEDAEANEKRHRVLPPGFGKRAIATTTVSYPIGLAPVKEGGTGLIVAWSTEKPERPYDFPLKDIWMLYLCMKRGSSQPDEVIFAPSVVIEATVAELAETRPDLDWIPGADAPTHVTPSGVGFGEPHDCEWMCPERAASWELNLRITRALASLGISAAGMQRFGHCQKCELLSAASHRKLQNRPAWKPEFEELVCACA